MSSEQMQSGDGAAALPVNLGDEETFACPQRCACGYSDAECRCDEMFDDEYDASESAHCFWCSGDGWVECDDPIQCTRQHQVLENDCGAWQFCPCGSCGGSGLAKDMTIW